MGINVDLQWLLGLPEKIRCPNCNNLTGHDFGEYDIDCGDPEARDGYMNLDCCCDICDNDFYYEIKLTLPSIKLPEDFE